MADCPMVELIKFERVTMMAWGTRQPGTIGGISWGEPSGCWYFEDPRERVLLEIRSERQSLLAMLRGMRQDARLCGRDGAIAAIRAMQLDLVRLRRAEETLTREPADPRLHSAYLV